MSRWLALEHTDGNVLFGPGGDRRALYRLQLASYTFGTATQKQRLVFTLADAIAEAKADGSIWRVCRSYPAERYRRQASEMFDASYADRDLWEWHLEGHEQLMHSLSPREVECYAAFRLPGPGDGAAVIGDAKRALWRLSHRVERVAGVAQAAPISEQELADVRASEADLFGRLAPVFGATGIDRAQTREIQWLLARARCRGLSEPELDRHWRPRALMLEATDRRSQAYRPLRSIVERAASARMSVRARHVEVESEHGTSFQSGMVLGALPENPRWPGADCELMFTPLERLEFPVDAVLHFRYIDNEPATREARRRALDVQNTAREEASGVLGDQGTAADTEDLATLLMAYLKRQDHPPLLIGALQLIVGAGSQEELEQRVRQVKRAYGGMAVHVPTGLQRQLYYEHFPRCGSAVGDWDDPLTVEQVGAMVPMATTQTGSQIGPYLGYTPTTHRVIKFDVTEASRDNAGSAVLLAGGLGSGKTVAAEAVVISAVLRGSQAIALDPKPGGGDHRFHLYEPVAHLVDRFALTSAEENRGALDPMRVPLIEEREEVALSYYAMLLGQLTMEQPGARATLQNAIRECMHASEWGSLAVLARLAAASSTIGKALARDLEGWSDFGMARLAFGAVRSDDVQARGRLTSILMPTLELPGADQPRATYNDRQKMSVATLGLLADMALRLASGDRKRNKVILFDEAWFLLASPEGQALFQRLVRMGRAMNAVILIATQSMADVGELSKRIGTFMAFGMDDEDEVTATLRLMGLPDAGADMVARVQSYKEGLCLMRDINLRIGEVQINIEPGMLAALQTGTGQRAAG